MTVPSNAGPWIERFARAGYLAKGAVYLLIGILALQAAAGAGGRTVGASGALHFLLHQPLGRWMLGLVAAGLAGYAVWRAVTAVADPESRGRRGWKRAAVRAGYAGSAIVHAGLAWQAVRLAVGAGGGGGDGQAQSRTAQLLDAPLGPWLVGIVALVVAGYGVAQVVRGVRTDGGAHMSLGALGPDERRVVLRAARAGLISRGVVFGIIGLLLARAALDHDAAKAGGLAEALEALERQPYAPFLLGAVALGLAAYGAYQLALARYRVIVAR